MQYRHEHREVQRKLAIEDVYPDSVRSLFEILAGPALADTESALGGVDLSKKSDM